MQQKFHLFCMTSAIRARSNSKMLRRTLTCLLAFGLLASAVFAEDLAETRKKAEQGNTDAQFSLGLRYATGDGVPKDEVEAVRWYRKAAEQGDVQAQTNLGGMYYNGTGVPKDLVQTHMWWWCSAHPELLVPGTPSVNKIGSLDQ